LPTSLFGFLSTKLFSPSAKLRLFLEPFLPRGQAAEESVGAFVQRRLGQEFLDYAINPLVSGIYAGDPQRLSVQHAFPKIAALEARYGSLIRGQIFGARERKRRGEVSKAHAKKFSFDEGLQVLPDQMHARLGDAVHLNSTVTAVARNAAAWSVAVQSGGKLNQADHSAVLFAATAYQLADLRLDAGAPADLKPFAEIHYPPVASVVLGFRREDVLHPACGFGMLIPRIEGFNILGTIFSSSLFPNRAPAGHLTLTSYLGGASNPKVALQPPEALIETTLQDLRVLLGVTGRPTYQHLSVYPRAIPQYELGYGRFKKRMDDLEASAPGFFLAGHFRDGISLSDSIVSGLRAAERIEAFVRSVQAAPVPA
jgi:oxygen-dependent protoporphyrinogen oxidase